MKVLSVICARGGSKGLKNKCMARIDNKMVIEYSIEFSLSLPSYVKTVVSTDIDEIIDFCRKNDIEHIRRDIKLCEDDTRIEDVLADAIEKKGKGCNYCSLLYGNIPTRYLNIFHEGLRFLEDNTDYNAAISMQCVGKFVPEWMLAYNADLLPKMKEKGYRRQTLPLKMIHDGHTLIFRSEEFVDRWKGLLSYESGLVYSVFGNRIKPLINDELIVDIDSEKDLKTAKAVIACKKA